MSDDEEYELTEAIVAFERNLWSRLVGQGLNEETITIMKRARRLYDTNETILRHHRELERVTGVHGIVALVEQFFAREKEM